MHSHLFDQAHLEAQGVDRFHLQNSKMLKATLGGDVLALKGSMVAYQGQVRFDHEGAGGFGKFVKKMMSSDDVPLMRASGNGEVFFADQAKDIFLIDLTGDALSINGKNLLAFEANGVSWDLHRVQGAGVVSGGLWNMLLSGTGKVAITTDGPPVLLDCSQQATYVDMDAVVGWSANLTPNVVSSMNFKSLLRGGSGEAMQLQFQGPGFVIVQPSEGRVPPPCPNHSGNSGGGLSSLLG